MIVRPRPRAIVTRASILVLGSLALSMPPAAAAPGAPLSALAVRPANPTCLAGPLPPPESGVGLEPAFSQIAPGRPFDVRVSPLDARRFYFINRVGLLSTFIPGSPSVPALDITRRIGISGAANAYAPGGSEHWGLVSFAFHPQFASDPKKRWVFLLFNGRQQGEATTTSFVVRYALGSDGLRFDPGSALTIIQLTQSSSWLHHFGHLAFGPDGYLYIGSGDGTLNGYPHFLEVPSRDRGDLRGKILRLDVNNSRAGAPYAIPPDNPWLGGAARPELYAIGLRNPWRFSFDPETRELWLGDVGESLMEEVNIIRKGGNYGWQIREGTRCRMLQLCGQATEPPVYEIAHAGRSMAIIGGHVYRGRAIAHLVGKYVFSVYGTNEIYALSRDGAGAVQVDLLVGNAPSVTAFFIDAARELYAVSPGGLIHKLVPVASDPNAIPRLLSQTGCVDAANPRLPARGLIPFAVNAELWSDGAGKARFAALPDGRAITLEPDGDFTFPEGSVLMKSFFFRGKPFETRLLKHHDGGTWAGYTYQWRSDGTDAALVAAVGRTITVETGPDTSIQWRLPSRGECLTCHTKAAGVTLGPEVAQLNSLMPYPGGADGHQLVTWNHLGLIAGGLPRPVYALPALAVPSDTKASHPRRARSYLHANCSSCHRPGVNNRATMDLRYDTETAEMNVCDVVPRVSNLGIADARLLAPGDPDRSILLQRMARRRTGQMPPLGTTIVDPAHLMIAGWIRRADVCSPPPDSDGDGLPASADNCTRVPNASQWDSDGDRFGDRCDGDFDNDLDTDANDRRLLVAAQGAVFGGAGYRMIYDFNLDGRIGPADLQWFDNRLAGKAPGPSGQRAAP